MFVKMDNGVGNGSSSSSDFLLRQLNKNSLKISKPIRKPFPLSDPNPAAAGIPDPNPNNPPQSQQPPVYNINKDDFRDVVQKLTGSPAYERLPAPPPPPASATRPPSSRLQRIRPPPLAQITNRPGQMAQILPRPHYDAGPRSGPLPPLPSVHTAAESPISAYMRYIQNPASPLAPSEFGQRPLTPAESPVAAYMRFFQNSGGSSSAPPPPPLGCVPSPRSPYGMKSSGFLFSQAGQLGLPPQLPLSPTGSPRWKGI